MEAYRVLLVDDEVEIRQGISKKIDWQALGFTLVGEAENGAEALDMALDLSPDVVLTDIKMPYMDGLELCRQLRTHLPAAKLVVFSGFDDFEYARTAIGMHVSQYILKPINAPELVGVLTTIRQQLDDQRAERRDMEELRKRYEESLPVLRELFFTRLLGGHIPQEESVERAKRYNIDLSGNHWIVALVQVEGGLHLRGDELLLLSVHSFIDEAFGLDVCEKIHLVLCGEWVAVLTALPNQQAVYPFIQEMTRLCALAPSRLGLSITVGVSRLCTQPDQMKIGVEEAKAALQYRVLWGAGRTIYIGDLEQGNQEALSLQDEDERNLAAVVKLGTQEELETQVRALVERVEGSGVSLSQCQFYLMELVTALVKLCHAGGVDPQAVFGDGFHGSVQVSDFASLKEMGQWYCRRCEALQDILTRQRTDSAGRLVEKAKVFINNNYSDCDLNVNTLCAHLYLSPAYFSTLFKRETNLSFTAYVTAVRMEVATRMLLETDEKTYRIAQEIGFSDANYFSYVFKRHFGVSPSKYRQNASGV